MAAPPTREPSRYALKVGRPAETLWHYDLHPDDRVASLTGRLHIHSHKAERTNYRLLETVIGAMEVESFSSEPVTLPRFDGCTSVTLKMPLLRALVEKGVSDWQVALTAVGGIYLITDEDGGQYVGSASGAEGLWGPWRNYAPTGHGGTVELRSRKPDGFRFAILETFDPRTERSHIPRRETCWKNVLGSRVTGLNLN